MKDIGDMDFDRIKALLQQIKCQGWKTYNEYDEFELDLFDELSMVIEVQSTLKEAEAIAKAENEKGANQLDACFATAEERWDHHFPTASYITHAIVIGLSDGEIEYEHCPPANTSEHILHSQAIEDEQRYQNAVRERDILERRSKLNGDESIAEIHAIYDEQAAMYQDRSRDWSTGYSRYDGYASAKEWAEKVQEYTIQEHIEKLRVETHRMRPLSMQEFNNIEKRYSARKSKESFLEWVRGGLQHHC